MDGRITLIFGKTGSGKTTLAKSMFDNESRIIIVDPQHEYNSGIVCYSFDDLINYIVEREPAEFCFVCRFSSDTEIIYLFKLVKLLGCLLLVVEEAEIYISPRSESSDFLDLVRYGRHQEIKILGIARRVSELSINFRAQTSKIISLKQTEQRDIDILKDCGLSDVDKLENFVWSPENKIPIENINYKVALL